MPVEKIFATSADAFVATGADVLEHRIEGAIERRGRCVMGLSGGSTPGPVYRVLGNMGHIDWAHVHIFLIDDRCVPSDHADSNQKLIRETLLASAAIPSSNIVFPNATLAPEECAEEYAKRLAILLHDGFDISILGMGSDGHIASLFPPLPAGAVSPDPAIHTQTPLKPDGMPLFAVRDRITVTLPILYAARWTLVMLKQDKYVIWKDMEASAEGMERWPLKALADNDLTLLCEQSAV